MRTTVSLVAATILIAAAAPVYAAQSGFTTNCNRITGECDASTTSTETTETTKTTETTIPGTAGVPGAPLWSAGAGNPQTANLPVRELTAAEKAAIRRQNYQRDVYGVPQGAQCGVMPAPKCPEPTGGAPVQQVNAPGAPAQTVTTTTVTIEEVIEQAKAKIKLPKPTIGSAPCTGAGCKGTVGVPTWFWLDGSEWQEQSDSASAGGHSVTVTAKPSKVVWSLGDGQSVTCTGPGTKYVESMGWASSPDCGLPAGYKKAGSYTVTADLTYDVTVSGDANETESVTMSSSEDITVREIQVVIK